MTSPIKIITFRELGSFFDSLTAYILIIAFLGFSGFFTWIYGGDIFIRKEADLQVFSLLQNGHCFSSPHLQ